ncbi:hypothetical protein PD5205_00946 [Xanthomonas fragariae]|uniref:Uncharacterized protein n=1 Tax=Xanthomonas fragariae TaxID=48664 RepID=A0A1Y6GYP8_9XANT|nr:hypothetical protein NBC2815_03063 [Xanthomonas fragariae]SMR00289.1 hypothetical protein PD885_03067 [Xanthomonas fragariae]SMR02265.1 hypothetical protein PD5205_00946 [Xanthomonas fragariae]
MVHADSEHRPRPPGGGAVVLLAALSAVLFRYRTAMRAAAAPAPSALAWPQPTCDNDRPSAYCSSKTWPVPEVRSTGVRGVQPMNNSAANAIAGIAHRCRSTVFNGCVTPACDGLPLSRDGNNPIPIASLPSLPARDLSLPCPVHITRQEHILCSHQTGHAGIDDIGDRIGVVTHMRPVTVLLGRIGNGQIQPQVIGRRIAQTQVDAVTAVRSSSRRAPEPAACRHGYAWRNPLLYRLQSRVQ